MTASFAQRLRRPSTSDLSPCKPRTDRRIGALTEHGTGRAPKPKPPQASLYYASECTATVPGEFISVFSQCHHPHNGREAGQFAFVGMARSDTEAPGATRGKCPSLCGAGHPLDIPRSHEAGRRRQASGGIAQMVAAAIPAQHPFFTIDHRKPPACDRPFAAGELVPGNGCGRRPRPFENCRRLAGSRCRKSRHYRCVICCPCVVSIAAGISVLRLEEVRRFPGGMSCGG